MNCTHRNAIREEREAIAAWLTNRGQKWAADRIISGEHHAPGVRSRRDDPFDGPVRYRENDEPAYRNDETQT
jgi:hypothetical protein